MNARPQLTLTPGQIAEIRLEVQIEGARRSGFYPDSVRSDGIPSYWTEPHWTLKGLPGVQIAPQHGRRVSIISLHDLPTSDENQIPESALRCTVCGEIHS